MDASNFDSDPIVPSSYQPQPIHSTGSVELSEEANRIQLRAEAFRDLADRFYMLWWNLPKTHPRRIDVEIQDMFRMYMDLAPSLGVSRNGIPELRECCGRKREWPTDPLLGDPKETLIAPAPFLPEPDERLGWCPGDIIRRVSRFLGFKYCKRCDRRRRAINAFFFCGKRA